MIELTIKDIIECKNLPESVVKLIAKDLTFDNPIYADAVKHGRYIKPDVMPKLVFYDTEYDITRVPKGYIYSLEQILNKRNLRYTFIDQSVTGKTLNLLFHGKLRPYQHKAVKDILQFKNGFLEAKTGSGKCLGINTPILMHNGTIKMVQNIYNGDLLMGPDSTPRRVSGIVKGRGPLYRVTPVKGDSFICNDEHILSLQKTGRNNTEIIDISILDYFKWNKTKKHLYKLWRTGVDFNHIKIPFDPYLIGVYLGDGSKYNTGITLGNKKQTIIAYLNKWTVKHRYLIRIEEQKSTCSIYHIVKTIGHGGNTPNPFRNFCLNKLKNNLNERVIPKDYLINDRSTRLSLLAGLLDTDGYLSNNSYEITCKDKIFADQICFLVRSLGLAAYRADKKATIKATKFVGIYHRVTISGDINKIPTKRHAPTPRKQIKSVLRTGFTIESIGIGNYYGFELDGDRRFVLGNFTVTHNTVTACYLIAERNIPTLIVVHNTELLYQWQSAIKKFLGIECGLLGNGRKSIKPITVGIVNTVTKHIETIRQKFGYLILDEGHRIVTDMWLEVILNMHSRYITALSATPYRRDGLTNALFFIAGPIVHKINEQELTRIGAVLVPDVIHVRSEFECNPREDYTSVIKALTNDVNRNTLIYKTIKRDLNTHAEPILFVSDRVAHCKLIAGALEAHGVTTAILAGKMNKSDRKLIAKKVKAGRIQVLLSTISLIGEGFDSPILSALILGTPVSFTGRLTQVGGRILRPSDGKNKPRIYDIVDPNVRILRRSMFRRRSTYKKLGWM